MRFVKCFIVVILFPFLLFSQDSDKYSIAFDFIKSNLKKDIYYYTDFEKDSIPSSTIYCSDELMNYSFLPFADDNLISMINKDNSCSDISCLEDRLNKKAKYNRNTRIPRLGKGKSISNYIVFFTPIEENILIAEVLYLREEYFNIRGDTERETSMQFNSGISYLFLFGDGGCMYEIISRGVSYH